MIVCFVLPFLLLSVGLWGLWGFLLKAFSIYGGLALIVSGVAGCVIILRILRRLYGF